ncbi:MAG TPA: sulfate ABC transporter substrate-binding protein [Gemmatimonadaceae bacterium]|nr:sulfate ABC transporter substrate-binding protein [Gemmatimonadaceae bacterium]
MTHQYRILSAKLHAVRVIAALLPIITLACSGEKSAAAKPATEKKSIRTLTLGAYSTPREAYGRSILPAFAREWQKAASESLRFETSYQGSGAQARAIAAGFEADIAALSLDPDLATLEKAKLVTNDWRKAANGGIVSRSLVVIGVRPGNPKNIRDWDDLRKPGIKVVMPNPKTSGGAMWNVLALYGSALRGLTSAPKGDSAAAQRLIQDVVSNVEIMDKGAREAMLTFERGVGDATITYENEVLVARQAGKPIDYVVPKGTIVIENPVAVVDAYADRHGNRAVAEAFVRYLASDSAQAAFTRYGLRRAQGETSGIAPIPATAFTVRDLGGWNAVMAVVFGPGGVFERATEAATKRH